MPNIFHTLYKYIICIYIYIYIYIICMYVCMYIYIYLTLYVVCKRPIYIKDTINPSGKAYNM